MHYREQSQKHLKVDLKNKKNILFTFDYELFLGKRSGSVQKCCIEPTSILIKIFDEFKIKNAIFFVDTTYLLRLKENNDSRSTADFIAVSNQIQELIKKGHYVFPHIHPHWLDANYLKENNQWDLYNNSRYRFSHLNELERMELFKKSVEVLQEIIIPIAPQYKIDSYRAGGWCIQPFADFMPSFEEHKIVNDFSVMRSKVNTSDIQFYDFRNAPYKNIYTFENDPLVESKNGRYKEYSISILNISSLNQFLNKLLLAVIWRLKYRSMGDGVGSVASAETAVINEKEIKEMVSMELLTDVRLPLYLKYIKKNEYMHFISHPKMLSHYNLVVFRKFLAKFTSRYEFETDYKKMLESL